jgi:hypothetical protein
MDEDELHLQLITAITGLTAEAKNVGARLDKVNVTVGRQPNGTSNIDHGSDPLLCTRSPPRLFR